MQLTLPFLSLTVVQVGYAFVRGISTIKLDNITLLPLLLLTFDCERQMTTQ